MRTATINKSIYVYGEGYISSKMSDKRIKITDNMKKHWNHKPYQNDFGEKEKVKGE